MARDSHCPVADLAPALAVILKQGGPAARSRIADLVESGLALSAVNVPKDRAARVNALAFAIGLAAAKQAKQEAPADLAPAPAAFGEAARLVAADLARRLHNPAGPEVPFQALQDMEEAARFIDSVLALQAPAPRLSEKAKAAASFFAAHAPASVLKGGKA